MTISRSVEDCFVVPRKLVYGIIAALLANAGVIASAAISDHFRIAALEEADTRILGRGDTRYAELKGRVDVLERDRNGFDGRLVRLEEQVKVSNDLLREIRQDMRRR